MKVSYTCQKKPKFLNQNSLLSLLNEGRISKSSYEKAYSLESPLKTEHLQTSRFIKKEAFPMMFYYEL